jgi:hypothetical protein
LLLMRGYREIHLTWRKVAPQLDRDHFLQEESLQDLLAELLQFFSVEEESSDGAFR